MKTWIETNWQVIEVIVIFMPAPTVSAFWPKKTGRKTNREQYSKHPEEGNSLEQKYKKSRSCTQRELQNVSPWQTSTRTRPRETPKYMACNEREFVFKVPSLPEKCIVFVFNNQSERGAERPLTFQVVLHLNQTKAPSLASEPQYSPACDRMATPEWWCWC